ncbi:NudC domain-containing protein 3 [Fasciolopsis buskii]|uniref:NudC domain-containing protein 3 n=1 Tax=Fasciolopsis buskii TaxID=27845 RepID=A0A8E0RWF7_9TREM|nr:NudC domain-containing protein 3 [Fasciolopsis buski]
MNPQYDNALLGILQHEGKIEKFLDVVFGFLMRRTDFYHVMTSDQKKLGFPPGVNFRMVAHAYEKYKNTFEQYEHQRAIISDAKAKAAPKVKEAIASSCELTKSHEAKRESTTVASASANSLPQQHSPKISGQGETGDANADNDSAPSVYQADPDCYNGARCDRYTWSQTIKDIDIKVKVPSSVKTAKDLKVVIERKNIRIMIRKEGGEPTYFDGTLCWDIHKDEAMWTLHPKENHIHFCLDKVQERWWEAAFEGEDKINTRKIDCSRPMHELDEEAQAKIQQLLYDEQCKRRGLPTSEQQKVQKMLSEAWNKEGSPFQGTDFDPSKICISTLDSSSGPAT